MLLLFTCFEPESFILFFYIIPHPFPNLKTVTAAFFPDAFSLPLSF